MSRETNGYFLMFNEILICFLGSFEQTRLHVFIIRETLCNKGGESVWHDLFKGKSIDLVAILFFDRLFVLFLILMM